MRDIIRANFPEKKVLATGNNEPSLSWMAAMDTVCDSEYKNALVIVTDTANQPRVDDERYRNGNYLIKIDHHPNNDPYGDICYVDENASSASEIITDFAINTQLSISDEAARVLYAGIVGDTGRFLYPSTTSKTMLIAAKLRESNVDFASIARHMDSFPLKIAKLQAYIFEHIEISQNGAARIVLTQEILKKFNITEAESSAIVSTLGQIEEIKVWAVFIEQTIECHFRVRLRSKTVVINRIAQNHNGGGHPLASGANSYSLKENDLIFKK